MLAPPASPNPGAVIRPIKLVRVITRLNIGGPAIHALLLTEGLNPERFRSILVTGVIGQGERDMLYVGRQCGVNPIQIPELGREISWWDDLVALWKLYRLLKKERPDILHTHTAKAGAIGRVAALAARVPVRIHTFHGHVFHSYFSPLKTRVFIWIERVLARITTKIIAISQAQLADLSSRYRIASGEKFQVIPLGLDLASLLEDHPGPERIERVESRGELTIGFVGRLVPVKNPLLACRVFERVVKAGTVGRRIRLVIAGDGDLRPELEAYLRSARLDSQVEFTGWCRDISGLYRKLDALILTSRNEGTPVALIEAMAASLPFLATAVGGVFDLMVGPERVTSGPDGRALFTVYANGILAGPGDEEGLAAALAYLLSDAQAMASMGRAGRRFVRERFSKNRLLADMQALYEQCLHSRRRVGRETNRALSWGAGRTRSNKKVEA